MTRSPWPQAPACCTSRPPNCSPTHTSSACSWAPLRLSVLFGGILLSEVAQYHLDHIFPTLCMRFGRLRVALENQRKRVLIGHIEKAQRADRGVDKIGRAHVELQSLMRLSYAVFCLKKKREKRSTNRDHETREHNI